MTSLRGRRTPDPIALSQDEAHDIASQVLARTSSPHAFAMVSGSGFGSTDFSRNEVDASDDSQWVNVGVTTIYGKKAAAVYTDLLDDSALAAAVMKAETLARSESVPAATDVDQPAPGGPSSNPDLWQAHTLANVDPSARLAHVRSAIAAIEDAGMIGAGSLGVSAQTTAVMTKDGYFNYGRVSTCTYSVTARTKDGTGSGWAGWKGENWGRADPEAMAERAIDLARRTENAVAIEPGRYTVVMSPVALGALLWMIAKYGLYGPDADDGRSPFSQKGGGNKIGSRMFDERVTLLADPMDPDGGFLPFAYDDGSIQQYDKISWVENGMLRHLSYGRAEAKRLGLRTLDNSRSLRMMGGTTTVEEMIAATQRGVYVTRFSNVSLLALRTFLMTGVTRDGTFLIENGKLTKPIKNFRFQDSPFFFLNNLDSLGPSERVPVGVGAYVMPSVKVRDFTFTSLSDAV